MKRYTRRKSYKVKILFSLLFLIILCMMAGKVLNSDFTLLPLDNITHHVASEDNGWNLILVNRNSYIPDDYKVELTELSNGEKVDSEFIQNCRKCLMTQGRKGMVYLSERDIGRRKNNSSYWTKR